MISIDRFQAARLCDLQEGDLFVSAEGKPIIAGRIAVDEVFVMLEAAQPDREPFEFFRRQPNPRRGRIHPKVQFEVDEATIRVTGNQWNLEVGELAIFEGGFGICAYAESGEGRELVELRGAFNPQEEPKHLLCFPEWQIVVGEGDNRHIVFQTQRHSHDGR